MGFEGGEGEGVGTPEGRRVEVRGSNEISEQVFLVLSVGRHGFIPLQTISAKVCFIQNLNMAIAEEK